MTASEQAAVEAPPALQSDNVQERKLVGRARQRATRKSLFITYLILVPGAVLFVAPFVWLISASFQGADEIFANPPTWIPDRPTTLGYQQFLNVGELTDVQRAGGSGNWRWFANSAFVAITVTVLQTLFNSLCAYAFAKRKFPGRDILFFAFLGTMMLPPQISLIPNYIILKRMPFFGGNDAMGLGGHGMLDSYWGLILPGCVSAFGIFLLRQYMMSIPDELLDAARVDGANEFQIYWRVVMPLCVPALAATAIFTFQGAWEDFLWPLIILNDEDLFTAPLGLGLFVVQNRTNWTVLFAGSVICTLPMVIVFIIFQRKFIQGIALTGVKG